MIVLLYYRFGFIIVLAICFFRCVGAAELFSKSKKKKCRILSLRIHVIQQFNIAMFTYQCTQPYRYNKKINFSGVNEVIVLFTASRKSEFIDLVVDLDLNLVLRHSYLVIPVTFKNIC